MTRTLTLGVIDVPYAAPENTPRRVRSGKGQKPIASTAPAVGAETTGDVAEWLENKYHIMEVFEEVHHDDILQALTDDASKALQNLISGKPDVTFSFGGSMAKTKKMFDDFISNREIETLGIPGVPTKAALNGVSHRFKNKKGGRRVSFYDTGAYVNHFYSEID
jgi:DNA-binding transcriptional regulator LsrR (DeoR family)